MSSWWESSRSYFCTWVSDSDFVSLFSLEATQQWTVDAFVCVDVVSDGKHTMDEQVDDKPGI